MFQIRNVLEFGSDFGSNWLLLSFPAEILNLNNRCKLAKDFYVRDILVPQLISVEPNGELSGASFCAIVH